MSAHLERLHQLLILVVVEKDVSIVEGGQKPGLGRMNVHAFHSVRAGQKLSVDFESMRWHLTTEKENR